MDELKGILSEIETLRGGDLSNGETTRAVLARMETTLIDVVNPNPEKRRKIRDAMTQMDQQEIYDAIDRLRYARLLRDLFDERAWYPQQTIPDSAHVDTVACKMLAFCRERKYNFASTSQMLYTYFQSEDCYMAMTAKQFLKALLDKNDAVTLRRTEDMLVIFNGTKRIALHMAHVLGCETLQFCRYRFLQGGNAELVPVAGAESTLASFFEGTMAPDDVCAILSRSDVGTPNVDLVFSRFLRRAESWKELILFLMDCAIYGHYSLREDELTTEEDGNWILTVMDVFSIYCYRERDGCIDVLCFSDPSNDGVKNGTEMYDSHGLYGWTVKILRETVVQLQARTLAMFDRISWFREQNKPFDFDAETMQT